MAQPQNGERLHILRIGWDSPGTFALDAAIAQAHCFRLDIVLAPIPGGSNRVGSF